MLNRKKIEAFVIANRTNDIQKIHANMYHIDNKEELQQVASILGCHQNHDVFKWLIALNESNFCKHRVSNQYIERFDFTNGQLVYTYNDNTFRFFKETDIPVVRLVLDGGVINFGDTPPRRTYSSRLFFSENNALPHKHFDVVKYFETR